MAREAEGNIKIKYKNNQMKMNRIMTIAKIIIIINKKIKKLTFLFKKVEKVKSTDYDTCATRTHRDVRLLNE